MAPVMNPFRYRNCLTLKLTDEAKTLAHHLRTDCVQIGDSLEGWFAFFGTAYPVVENACWYIRSGSLIQLSTPSVPSDPEAPYYFDLAANQLHGPFLLEDLSRIFISNQDFDTQLLLFW